MTAIVAYVAGGIWLVSLLAAIFAPRKARRLPPIAVLVTTLAFGAVWGASLFESGRKSAAVAREATRSAGGSCASIEEGQTEEIVRTRLGAPTETRSEAELRGPGANVWIYRDSRCAVHLLDGAVESVD
jgi:hypothetical protein